MSEGKWNLREIGETIFGALAVLVCLVFSPLLRGWYNRWGATTHDLFRTLPGDERTPDSVLGYTRAIIIRAAPDQIWPWLAQLGQGKGGLYSYDHLENLIGCQMHNAEKIMPEYQQIQVGDVVRLGPKGYPLYKITLLTPGRAMLLTGADPKTENYAVVTDPMPETYLIYNWLLFLDPQPDGTTRLISRTRMAYNPGFGNWFMWRVLMEPINFVMERKMLLGIKQRAESLERQLHPVLA